MNTFGCDTANTFNYAFDLSDHPVLATNSNFTACVFEVFAGHRHLAHQGGGTTFSHADWLGTERVRSSYNGNVCEWISSLPFGDAQTTSGGCYHPSSLHFTGKERDSESGLDNFGARFDSSTLGRFMSPDPENFGANSAAPQTWNAYSYVLNNPLNAVDPDGLDCVYTAGAEGNPDPHKDGSATIVHGDCINAGGKDDGGVFVDNAENHPVMDQDVSTNKDGSMGLVTYTHTDGFTKSFECFGNCPHDSVQVTSAPPGMPTISPDTNPRTIFQQIFLPPVQIPFQRPPAAVTLGCTLGLDADLMENERTPNNGNDKPESKLAEGKYKVPLRRGIPGRPPEMNKSGKESAEAVTAYGGLAALLGNQQNCLQNAAQR